MHRFILIFRTITSWFRRSKINNIPFPCSHFSSHGFDSFSYFFSLLPTYPNRLLKAGIKKDNLCFFKTNKMSKDLRYFFVLSIIFFIFSIFVFFKGRKLDCRSREHVHNKIAWLIGIFIRSWIYTVLKSSLLHCTLKLTK